jgi:hypothetical protein
MLFTGERALTMKMGNVVRQYAPAYVRAQATNTRARPLANRPVAAAASHTQAPASSSFSG